MSNKKGIIIIIFLILLSIVLSSYIIYDKFLKKEEEKSTTIKIDSVDVNIEDMFQINEILNTFDKAFNDPSSKFFAYPYKNKLYMKKFDKEAAIYVSMYDEIEKSNIVQTIRESKVKANFSKIFGDNLKYERKNFEVGSGYKIEFGTTDYVAYISPTKSNDLYPPEYIIITTKTNIEDNKVILTRKLAYIEYVKLASNNEVSQAIVYKDKTKSKEIGRVNLKNGEIRKDEIVGSFSSKLSTYLYTFNYHKSKYSLYKISEK